MRVVIQRVKKASVSIDEQIVGNINQGLLILLGMLGIHALLESLGLFL